MAPLNDAPDYAPTYDGEVPAIRDVEAHGWTVWHHVSGFGHFTDAVAIHPSNPASPMRLASFERPGPRRPRLLFWWRPMHQIPTASQPGWPKRLKTYLPWLTRTVYDRERQP